MEPVELESSVLPDAFVAEDGPIVDPDMSVLDELEVILVPCVICVEAVIVTVVISIDDDVELMTLV